MHVKSLDVACPRLHWKPLDAAIGQLFALYCPGGSQGESKQNIDEKSTHFAGRFDCLGDALAWLGMSATCPRHVKKSPIFDWHTHQGRHNMTLTQDFSVRNCLSLTTTREAPLTSKYTPSHMSNISESVPSPCNNCAANRAAPAAMLSTPWSTQVTVSTITTVPSGNKGVIDYTGGWGGGEVVTEESEQLPPLRSVFDCSCI